MAEQMLEPDRDQESRGVRSAMGIKRMGASLFVFRQRQESHTQISRSLPEKHFARAFLSRRIELRGLSIRADLFFLEVQDSTEHTKWEALGVETAFGRYRMNIFQSQREVSQPLRTAAQLDI